MFETYRFHGRTSREPAIGVQVHGMGAHLSSINPWGGFLFVRGDDRHERVLRILWGRNTTWRGVKKRKQFLPAGHLRERYQGGKFRIVVSKIQTREYIEFIRSFTENSNIMSKTLYALMSEIKDF